MLPLFYDTHCKMNSYPGKICELFFSIIISSVTLTSDNSARQESSAQYYRLLGASFVTERSHRGICRMIDGEGLPIPHGRTRVFSRTEVESFCKQSFIDLIVNQYFPYFYVNIHFLVTSQNILRSSGVVGNERKKVENRFYIFQ